MIKRFLRVEVSKRHKESDNKFVVEQSKQFPLAEVSFKRQRKNENDSVKDQHIVKKFCVMLVLMTNEQEDNRDQRDVEIHTLTSYVEAVRDFVWEELWKEAIEVELTALALNGTWKEVVPFKGVNIVTGKWVFKSKLQIDDKLDKLKARVVTRGFLQRHGVDYENTFAPTVKYNTLRIFLVIVAMKDLKCYQVNVNNVFIKSFLKEIIYIAASSDVKVAPDRVLRILRSLYDLKQAVRDWHQRCIAKLIKFEFVQSLADSCLLTHVARRIILLFYVDDIIYAARIMKKIQWFKKTFAMTFKIKNLRKIKKVLNVWITRDRKRKTLRMNQTHYLSKLFNKLDIEADKHKFIKISLNEYDALCPAGPEDLRIDSREYQHIIESLMYAMIHTRSDIALALSRLSQFLSDSVEHHEHALKDLLWYVRSTVNLGIIYEDSESQGLIVYFDSDYAMNKQGRRSILEYVYMLDEELVSSISRKQKSVTIFINEVEYMIMSTCVKKAL